MKSSKSRIFWRIAIGVLLVAPWAVLLWSRIAPNAGVVLSDGISVRVDADKAAGRTIVWDRPELVAIPELGDDEAFDPAYSPDGKSLVFARERPGTASSLWTSQQLLDGAGWSKPEPMIALDSPGNEFGAAWSPDGTRLYFVSDRPGGEGGYDIWVSQRTGDSWAPPVNAGPSVNSEGDEKDPAVSAAGDVLFFTSNREGAQKTDIYASVIESDETSATVESLNSPADDGDIAFTPRGDFAYFSSNRPGGDGGFDLYRARWRGDRFEPPVRLGATVNTWADEMDPALTLEGFELSFSSDRGTGPLPIVGQPRGIFVTISREVDAERADSVKLIGLGLTLTRFYEEWRGVLLWLGLALAGYIIFALAQRRTSSEPTLKARCFAISLLAHALLLGLFTIWNLTEALLEEPPKPAMEVGLSSDSLAAEKLSTEIRENVPALPAVEPAVAIDRFAPPPDFAPAEAPRLVLPALPDAEPVERPPVDPAFQIAEAVELAPILTRPLPAAPVIGAGATFEFALQKPVLDIGRPAEVADEPKLETPADNAGKLPTPNEPEMMPDKPAPAQVAAVEDDSKLVAPPMVSASRPPELEGDLAPSSPAMIPPPTVAIALDPLAGAGVEVVLQPLEVGAAQPQPDKPDQQIAPISDAMAQARPIEPADQPLAERTMVARLHLDDPVSGLEIPAVIAAAASNERPAILLETNLPDTDATQSALVALPQMLDLSGTPRLESPLIPDDPYLLRDPKIRDRVIEELGGSRETEKAVRQALDWFTRNQESDGRWNVQKFGGRPNHDVAGTSLVLLSYLGWGANHRDPGPHHAQVSRAVTWILSQMKEDGDLRGWDEAKTRPLGDMYDQGMAAMALSEAYGMTKDEALREPVEKAVAFIVAAQDPDAGSWRYHPFPMEKGGDTSIFGWQVMALRSAQLAGVDVPADALKRCEKWLNTIGGGKSRGLYGYRDANPKPAMVAEGLFCQQLLGRPGAEPKMQESVQYLGENLPAPNEVFFYYWYYAQLALYQNKGPVWDAWNAQMQATLLPMQHQAGGNAGSWDPTGPYGADSGRVVVTAMATLTLEVYFRYLPFYNAME